MGSPFEHLPALVRDVLGELAWDPEPRATCDACPLVAAGEQGVPYPFSMEREARCCTAHPQLANFLVGRVIDRPVIRARIAQRDGVSAWGIRAPVGYDEAFPERAQQGFGRDVTLRCPYWIGGDHACGVHEARSARCRAYHCRHERGLIGARTWSLGGKIGVALEAAIADLLVEKLGGVAADASEDELAAWFARCARAELTHDEAAKLVAEVALHREPLVELRRRRPEVRDVLVPAVSATQPDGEHVWVAGYSPFDAVRVPHTIFAFLAKLDGKTRWRDLLAAHPEIDEAVIGDLVRIGALE